MCGIFTIRCSKYSSLIWTKWNSDWERIGPSWIMSSLRQPFVSGVVDRSKSVMCILCTFSRNISARCNQQTSKCGELRGHSCGGINFGVTFSDNLVVAYARWKFQVSQGSVETLFKWGEKRLHDFVANLLGNYVPTFIPLARVLWETLWKTFWSLFPDTYMYACNTITFESYDIKRSSFGPRILLQGERVKFVYKVHRVKVKVTAVKSAKSPIPAM